MARRLMGPQLAAKEKAEDLNFSAWLEIDLDALDHNLAEIKKHTAAKICPVLKNDAYGHGAPVLAAFLANRASLLSVGTLEEALAVRQFYCGDLLILTPPTTGQLSLFFKYSLIPTVSSFPLLTALSQAAEKSKRRLNFHLKVDTGLGRLGFSPQETLQAAVEAETHPYLKLSGVYTHFAAAATNTALTKKQLDLLLTLKAKLRQVEIIWHAANSAAFASLPASHLDLARIGTLLYGQAPLALDNSWDLKETWRLRTRLIQIKKLPKGRPVGYGHSFRLKKAATVGIIPVGFGHGLAVEPQTSPRRHLKQVLSHALRKHEIVFSKNRPLPILGRIGMGLTCLDLTDFPDLAVNEPVTVLMRRVTASQSIPKVYLVGGRVKCVSFLGKIYTKGKEARRLAF